MAITAARHDLAVPKHQDFSFEVGFAGLDLVASAMSFHVRANLADPDPLLVATVGKVVETVDGEPYTTATVAIAKESLEALDEASPLGGDFPAHYGFKVDGTEWLAGAFTIKGQANHA